jgi:menaquinone-dependent protoporphyrinogen oxidase
LCDNRPPSQHGSDKPSRVEEPDVARVLVAHASKRGGTAGIATRIADELRAAGHDVTACPAGAARLRSGYEAAVVGSCLYGGRWSRPAALLVKKLAATDLPVWLFHSGPLGDERAGEPQDLPRAVERHRDRLQLRDAVTFGGRLEENPGGFIAGAMARNGNAGDWRDLDGRVAEWARGLAAALPG